MRLDILTQITSLLISVVTVAIAIWVALLTRVLAKETRLTREKSERAEVWCVVRPHKEQATFAILTIKNVGSGTAKNLKFSVSKTKDHYGHENNFTFDATVLLPQASLEFYIGTFMGLPENLIEVVFQYEDHFGLHPCKYSQDFSSWMQLPRVSEQPEFEQVRKIADISEELVRIRKVLMTISGSLEAEQPKIE